MPIFQRIFQIIIKISSVRRGWGKGEPPLNGKKKRKKGEQEWKRGKRKEKGGKRKKKEKIKRKREKGREKQNIIAVKRKDIRKCNKIHFTWIFFKKISPQEEIILKAIKKYIEIMDS